MRRLLIPALVALLAGVLSPAAQAADDAEIRLLTRWNVASFAGDPIVDNADRTGIIVANGFPIMLWIQCTGEGACNPERPARVEVLRDGAWVTWSAGTLLQMQEQAKEFTSKKSTLLRYRPVLPATDGLAEVIGPEYTIRYRPGAKVRVSGTAYVPASKANGYTPGFRARGSITVTLTPASAGRTVAIHDVGIVGWPLVATAKTDRRGRATIRSDFSAITTMRITVVPTASRAGWSGFAFKPPI